MRSLIYSGGLILLAGLTACSAGKSPRMEYYSGQNVPEGYIQVVRTTETEVEFRIAVKFTITHLYHLLLDGNEPVAEGWFPTRRLGDSQSYSVTLHLKKDLRLEPGKTYRLCIGSQNPEAVYVHSSTYRCLAEYEFLFEI
ncbi:MAG: hypothetical protein SCM96_01265 [Acidobacteriota bacterium]|nr:hypothetical protein [Acidobacteriota bacterium]